MGSQRPGSRFSVPLYEKTYVSEVLPSQLRVRMAANRGGRYALRRWALSAEAPRFPSFLRREATDRLVPRGEGCTTAPAASVDLPGSCQPRLHCSLLDDDSGTPPGGEPPLRTLRLPGGAAWLIILHLVHGLGGFFWSTSLQSVISHTTRSRAIAMLSVYCCLSRRGFARSQSISSAFAIYRQKSSASFSWIWRRADSARLEPVIRGSPRSIHWPISLVIGALSMWNGVARFAASPSKRLTKTQSHIWRKKKWMRFCKSPIKTRVWATGIMRSCCFSTTPVPGPARR